MAQHLVRFAGADSLTLKESAKRKPAMASRADELFQFGIPTMQIAVIMKISEARALRLVNRGRSARLGLPTPYPVSGANS